MNILQLQSFLYIFMANRVLHTAQYNPVMKSGRAAAFIAVSDSVKHISLHQGGLRSSRENLRLKGLV